MELSGNTILITGGTSGIGLEMVRQFSVLGNTILVTGRNQAKLDQAKKQFPKIHTFQSDVSDPKAINELYEKVIKQFPELNILINNAGVMKTVNLHDTSDDLLQLTNEIDVNLHGPIRMTKKFLTHLKTKKSAAIVNVSSGLAFVPLPTSPVYCATKAALHSFTLSLRVQLKKTNIKVFELAPPATQTELLGSFDSEDMKGISIMKVDKMVQAAVSGMRNDQFEIRPGQSNQLKLMSRMAPQFILNQMSRPVDRMLSATKQ
ncbi:MAG: SDR family NAD(P)-dependent oxidoreductase, partial [Bdellovibrionales bacterium]|nr:SDR family NAD(P)-dependent oxidoreductase [Bdellovibrionales bacterium]